MKTPPRLRRHEDYLGYETRDIQSHPITEKHGTIPRGEDCGAGLARSWKDVFGSQVSYISSIILFVVLGRRAADIDLL